MAPSNAIWYLQFINIHIVHKKNKDVHIYSTQIPHTKMYIQQFCPFFFNLPKSITLLFVFVAVTHMSAKISNTFVCIFSVCDKSVNLLYSRLTGVAFMYKLRPLDDNPIEHTGLQYMPDGVQTLNALSIFVICLLCLSPPLWRLRAITMASNGCLSTPTQRIRPSLCFSYICSSRLYTAIKGNAGKFSCLCPWQ